MLGGGLGVVLGAVLGFTPVLGAIVVGLTVPWAGVVVLITVVVVPLAEEGAGLDVPCAGVVVLITVVVVPLAGVDVGLGATA